LDTDSEAQQRRRLGGAHVVCPQRHRFAAVRGEIGERGQLEQQPDRPHGGRLAFDKPRTTERSGLVLPSRVIQAIQCGPRASA